MLPLRIMTYNVLNAFDRIDDERVHDPPKSRESVQAVATIISEAEPDVLTLQEVESMAAVEDILNQKDLGGRYPYRKLIDGEDRRGMDVAVVSRFPIVDFKLHQDRIVGWRDWIPKRSRRGVLQCDVRLPNEKTLRVFTAHFPSLRENPAQNERAQMEESKACKDIIQNQSRNYPVDFNVVTGDFNALEKSRVLDVLTNGSLRNLSEGLPPSYGHRFKEPDHWLSQRIDHILCDEALARHSTGGQVYRHPMESEASDHLPVIADFMIAA